MKNLETPGKTGRVGRYAIDHDAEAERAKSLIVLPSSN